MSNPAQRFASYDDLVNLPDNVVGEIIDGELETHPRPAPRHALTASALGIKLGAPFQFGDGGGPGGWWIIDEPEVRFDDAHILVPDLAGWRKKRMPVLPETNWFALAPDWVCEVLSPRTARTDRTRKMPAYAQFEVAYVWLVDPVAQTVEAYKREQRGWLLIGSFGGDQKANIEPFHDIALDLAALWI